MTFDGVDTHPATTAVLFVECQNGLLGPDSVMRSIGEAAQPAIAGMARLAMGARAAGAQVVHLTYAPAANNRSQNQRPPMFKRLHSRLDEWHATHPATEPIPEIGVGADDLVLQRHTGMSPTYGTETFKLLRNMGMKTVVCAGISVNVAIPMVATEAGDEDFDVIIPRDAVAGAPPEYAEAVLQNTLAFVATLCTVDDLLAEWGVAGATS